MLKYKGNGSLPGIPARNLTDEEVIKFGKRRLLESGLYVEVKKSRKETHREAGQSPAEVNENARD